MLIADIGNTNIHYGYLKRGRIVSVGKIPVSKLTPSFIIRNIIVTPKQSALICSVKPDTTRIFKKLPVRVYLAGADVHIPIKNCYRPDEAGSDRLVAAYSANIHFPGTRLVLDFGTAITLDFLSASGAYQGGLILPGIGSTLKVFSECALLPERIRIRKSAAAIPKNTRSSISKGMEEGFSSMLNALVAKYKKRLKINTPMPVVITGSGAATIIGKLNFPYRYEPLLILKGLSALAKLYLLR